MIGSLRARVARLEAERPSPIRRFILVAGAEEVDWGQTAALEKLGELVILRTGVCRDCLGDGLGRPVVWKQVGAAWIAADPLDQAA
jgi:hypothetical protein